MHTQQQKKVNIQIQNKFSYINLCIDYKRLHVYKNCI